MKINTLRKAGFTLVEIMIVVAIIGLLCSIALPNFVKARAKSQQDSCLNNLRQLDGAIQQWALETKQSMSAAPDSAAVANYIRSGVLPTCPSGEIPYVFAATIGTIPAVTCGNSATLPGHALPQ